MVRWSDWVTGVALRRRREAASAPDGDALGRATGRNLGDWLRGSVTPAGNRAADGILHSILPKTAARRGVAALPRDRIAKAAGLPPARHAGGAFVAAGSRAARSGCAATGTVRFEAACPWSFSSRFTSAGQP